MGDLHRIQFDGAGEEIAPDALSVELNKPDKKGAGGAQIVDVGAVNAALKQASHEISNPGQAVRDAEAHNHKIDEVQQLEELIDSHEAAGRRAPQNFYDKRVHLYHDIGIIRHKLGEPQLGE